MHRDWKRALLLGTVCLVADQSVQAQTAPNADELIRHGLEMRRRGDDPGALAEFRLAYDAGHSPRAAAQMGWAEQALGRWLDADGHVREALSATTDPWIIGRRVLLDASMAVINQHVGDLEILGGVAGALVHVDGRLGGSLPLARPVRALAGAVTLTVAAAGYRTVERQVGVVAGSLARETIDLQPVAAEAHRVGVDTVATPGSSPAPTAMAPHPAPVQATRASPLRPLGATGIGLGVAFVAGGVVAHALFLLGVGDFNRPGADA